MTHEGEPRMLSELALFDTVREQLDSVFDRYADQVERTGFHLYDLNSRDVEVLGHYFPEMGSTGNKMLTIQVRGRDYDEVHVDGSITTNPAIYVGFLDGSTAEKRESDVEAIDIGLFSEGRAEILFRKWPEAGVTDTRIEYGSFEDLREHGARALDVLRWVTTLSDTGYAAVEVPDGLSEADDLKARLLQRCETHHERLRLLGSKSNQLKLFRSKDNTIGIVEDIRVDSVSTFPSGTIYEVWRMNLHAPLMYTRGYDVPGLTGIPRDDIDNPREIQHGLFEALQTIPPRTAS
ncbi:hypothetical protein HYS00_02655 [Candidatus Microgenomates bacterium]|nr:hypothetical protein [Candidatus Microgenomates bacterium]